MRAALAPAKLNLSLRVFSGRADGYHPLDSIVLAVGWYDHLRTAESEVDRLDVDNEAVPTDVDNLVWKAIRLLRERTGDRTQLNIELSKRIPPAAGLGGGSSDAAAAIVAVADLLGLEEPEPSSLVGLGADVPFFFTGGLARMTGRGEHIDPLTADEDFAMAIVVPPIELATPSVYRRWDELGEPRGTAIPRRDVPPGIRAAGPLQNDLWPAALDLAPELGDWKSELQATWGTAVAMTGSGSGLFGFFSSEQEAEEAIRTVAMPVRAKRAAVPIPHGAILDPRYTPGRR